MHIKHIRYKVLGTACQPTDLPRETPARCAHQTATRLERFELKPLSSCLRYPQNMADPLSARARRRAAERPRYISKGSKQRATAQKEHVANTKKRDFAMIEHRTCRYSA
jgi:hypothetical protein